MTENVREEMLKDIKDGYIDEWDNLTIDELFEQIEREHNEIQQYRAIGTVEELTELIKELKETYKIISEVRKLAENKIAELKEFQSIGTVEEFKALKEKATPKKLEIEKFWGYDDLMCPNCKSYKIKNPKYCCDCGQKLDWE